jgi:hypothetical protein
MLTLAREWRESGTPARVFAQEHGVTTWTLYYWRQRVVRQERSARRRRRPRRVRLAPVRVIRSADGPGPDPDLEIILASGDRVRVSTEISADVLHRVVQVLRTGC